jgi:transcriptional regulator with XRE-family HTH domain
MLLHNLPNYIRAARKRANLSQRDLAFLMGYKTDSQVSRCERVAQTPTLRTALLFAFIFDVPLQELFAGLIEDDIEAIRRRTATLYKTIAARSPTTKTGSRSEFLHSLVRRTLERRSIQ